MDPGFHTIHRGMTNIAVMMAAVTAFCLLFGFLLFGNVSALTRAELVVAALFLSVCVVLQIGTFLVFRQNRSWRQVPFYLHSINHLFRDVLTSLFFKNSTPVTEDQLIDVEQQVLDKACSAMGELFRVLIGRRCQVTLYLIRDNSCFIWACNEQNVDRQRWVEQSFLISKDSNTRFQRILELIENKKKPIYFSRDILKENQYHDSLPDAKSFYRTVIVVPVKCTISADSGKQESRILGFLTLDSKSPGRLNDDYHAEFLAAFADQIFNFISVMRSYFRHTESVNVSVAVEDPGPLGIISKL